MSEHNGQCIVDDRSHGQIGRVTRECLETAVLAPSVHNSQPWRFRVHPRGIDVLVDRSRQLAVIDPGGRELLISVGAAVLNLRVAILGHGRVPILRVLPDRGEPDLVARVTLGPVAVPDPTVHALLAAIPRRHTNRRPFTAAAVPRAVTDELVAAAAAEGATLAITDPIGRDAILGLAATAEEWQRAEAGYRDELTSWTVPPYGRHDGVPAHAFGPHDRYESVPLRDFALTQPELHRRDATFEAHPTVLVLRTTGDGPRDWQVRSTSVDLWAERRLTRGRYQHGSARYRPRVRAHGPDVAAGPPPGAPPPCRIAAAVAPTPSPPPAAWRRPRCGRASGGRIRTGRAA